MSSKCSIVLIGLSLGAASFPLSGCVSVAKGILGMAGDAALCGAVFVDQATNGRMDLSNKCADGLRETLPGIYVSKEASRAPDNPQVISASPPPCPSVLSTTTDISAPIFGKSQETFRRMEEMYKVCNYTEAIVCGENGISRGSFSPTEERQALIRVAASHYSLGNTIACEECMKRALANSPSPGISSDEYPPGFIRRWQDLGGSVSE